jgi:hypothetical protein
MVVITILQMQYIEQIIAIAPRREPLETPIENPERTKHEND